MSTPSSIPKTSSTDIVAVVATNMDEVDCLIAELEDYGGSSRADARFLEMYHEAQTILEDNTVHLAARKDPASATRLHLLQRALQCAVREGTPRSSIRKSHFSLQLQQIRPEEKSFWRRICPCCIGA